MLESTREAAAPAAVLVVDDDAAIRGLCQRFLSRLGHQVDTAATAHEALERLGRSGFDVVITDLQMPGATGLELLARIQQDVPNTRSILMSGRAQAQDAAAAIEHGIDRLLVKPFSLAELEAAVAKALSEKRAQEQAARARADFDALVEQRELASRNWILRAAHALATAVEAKHAYTAGHAARVCSYAVMLAESIGTIDMRRFRLACELHDVGKIGVPDQVLNKPGKLTAEEFALVQRHPETGARILEPLMDDQLVIGVVRSHHERWDGDGYPDGLRGERIPLAARVVALADTLDAMTSSRAYREGLPWEIAVAEVRRCAGTQFDPDVVQVFERILPQLAQLYGTLHTRSAPAPGLGRPLM